MTYIPNKHLSVSELNNSIKKILERSISRVRVLGEISQLKTHSSGHVYLTLKDQFETISVVCWKTKVPRLSFFPVEGKKVFVSGKITTYSPQSKYQIVVENIELEGEGELLRILDERKKKLSKEGFFDESKKKKIPLCPRRIGVITSPTGAVIKDIIHRIKERFPIEIILYPVHVQGRLALNEIVESIKEFNSWKKNKNISKIVDLIIIARGGGDLEDLMPFNEEPLVKEIYASEIPIISAIGHESDITLCDFAADLRAPTPTAAAEIAVPVRSELYKKFKEKNNYFESLVSNLIDQLKIKLSEKVGRLPNLENFIQYNFQKLDLTEVKLESSIKENLIKKKLLIKKLGQEFKIESMFQKIKIFRLNIENTFSNIKKETKKILLDKKVNITEKKKLLDSLSYKRILARGYTVIWQKTKVITKSEEIKKLEEFKIEFYDGKIDAKKIN